MLAHMGSLQQAAYTRPIEYQEGRAHGLKAIEVLREQYGLID